MYDQRDGFCLGCGKEGKVTIPTRHGQPLPGATGDGPFPGWCRDPKCVENKQHFNQVADKILYGKDV